MSAVSSWLMSLVCAAFVCALVLAAGGDGAGKGTRELVCGLFLALTALSPLGGFELPELDLDSFRDEAESAVSGGVSQAEEARLEIISAACEAYILNKATELGLSLEARVELDADGLPESVTLSGQASPSERETLTGWITRDLGVGKEAQTWTDLYQSNE